MQAFPGNCIPIVECSPHAAHQGDLKTAARGAGTDARRRGGGFREMGFRVGPFVLCNNGSAPEHKFWPEKCFAHQDIFPHMCVVKMISATWGSF